MGDHIPFRIGQHLEALPALAVAGFDRRAVN
jgi:hypothetical protein